MSLPKADLKGANYFDILKKPSPNSIKPWCTGIRRGNVDGIEFGECSLSDAAVSPFAYMTDFNDFVKYSR